MYVLVTGATGKVGQHFINRLLAENPTVKVRALCHNRSVDEHERVDMVRGSISDREVCRAAMDGVTHVMHLATCKDVPEDVMDVTVKGLFWLLEEARQSACFERFVLVGGDASVGHIHYPREKPVTEDTPHKPYPGCYALSKVLEEHMLTQFAIQYDLDTCCVRAPWIMEKDDFKYSLKVGDEQFGGPSWDDLLSQEEVAEYQESNIVPILSTIDGEPIKRSFVHVDDLSTAMIMVLDHPQAKQELFHICVTEPV
ncbi:MAG: NAD(P)-dependent oxidoreductase, partial [Planctomycetes bacterium]|nr:NAD(P)-dependent oxidoreductase [Planctomycetota bacterium]